MCTKLRTDLVNALATVRRVRATTVTVPKLALVAFAGLVAGAALLVLGLNLLHDPQVTCGAHVMKPGDTCTYIDADEGPGKDDYAGVKHNQMVNGYAATIGGGLLVIGTGVGVTLVARRRPAT